LHRAIQGGYLEIVERLLEKHELEFYCDAPTMHAELLVSAAKAFEASPAESIPIIKLLLQHGCDVTARTADGNPLFASALGSGMFDDAEATSLVKALLIAKADPTLPNLEGETPLSIAVDRSWRFAVMELVQAGVDIKSDYHLSLYEFGLSLLLSL
jgi:ankyrin repeat protein